MFRYELNLKIKNFPKLKRIVGMLEEMSFSSHYSDFLNILVDGLESWVKEDTGDLTEAYNIFLEHIEAYERIFASVNSSLAHKEFWK